MMDEKEVIHALKSERCPPSVLKQVQAVIRSEKPSVIGWRWGIPVGISVALLVLLSVILVNIRDDSIVSDDVAIQNGFTGFINEKAPAAAAFKDYQAEAEDLKFALTYIGLTLAEETERNRDIILGRTVPVLMDSIENTEKYIHNKIREKGLL